MNIEEYGFDRADLVVATAVNAYLKNLTPEARCTTLAEVVKRNGAETVIDAEKLTTLIENAKATAMISAGAWIDGEGDYQRSLNFIRETLPTVDARKYIEDKRFITVEGNGRGRTNAYINGSGIDVGADIFKRGLCLPSDNKMTPEQQDVIIEIIHRCFR